MHKIFVLVACNLDTRVIGCTLHVRYIHLISSGGLSLHPIRIPFPYLFLRMLLPLLRIVEVNIWNDRSYIMAGIRTTVIWLAPLEFLRCVSTALNLLIVGIR